MATSWAKSRSKIDRAPAFLLHHHAWRETSLILDVFSRDKGRLSLAARGARRSGSPLRGVLLAFQPVLLSWFGAGEVKTLHAAEWQGGVPQLSGLPLMCGFYLNELIMRLLPRDDPHPDLFDEYVRAILALAMLDRNDGVGVEPILRRAELAMLAELGYGVNLHCDRFGEPFSPEKCYRWRYGMGFEQVGFVESGTCSGITLLSMAKNDFSDHQVALESKILMRQLLADILGDTVLHTRQLLRDLQKI